MHPSIRHPPTHDIHSPRPLLTNPKRLSYQQRTPAAATGGRRPIGGGSALRSQEAAAYDDDEFDMRDDDDHFHQGPPPEAEFPDTDEAAAAAAAAAKKEERDEKAPEQQQQQQQQAKGSRFSRQRKAIEAALPGAKPSASAIEGPAPIDPVAGVKVEGLEATAGGREEEEDDPYSISAAAAPAPGAAMAGGVKWEEVVQTDAESGEPYVPFFWVDAHEQGGVIYLFGKVKVGEGRYVSAACSVQGVQHALLVLPKRTGNAGPDGK
jgi:hypothetical protein